MNNTDDWYDLSRPTDHSYCLQEVGRFQQFLVTGAERALVVDAGIGVGNLRSMVASLVDLPVELLLTHSHWDHIGAATQFADVSIHERERAPDDRVGIDTLTDEFVARPQRYAERWVAEGRSLPDGFDPETYTIDPAMDVGAVAGGDTFDLGGRTLEVLHLPGHSPGHVAALDREASVLYGGDVIHEDHSLYLHFEDCELAACVASFDRLCDLRKNGAFDTLLTAHNPPVKGEELGMLVELRDGLREVADGDREYDFIETKYGPAHQFRVGESTVLTKPSVP